MSDEEWKSFSPGRRVQEKLDNLVREFDELARRWIHCAVRRTMLIRLYREVATCSAAAFAGNLISCSSTTDKYPMPNRPGRAPSTAVQGDRDRGDA